MLTRSTPSPRLALLARRALLLCIAAVLVAGPLTGCARNKARKHWWQFWRPKAEQTSKVYNPDTVVLPPAPDVLDDGSGSSSSLKDGLPAPPAPGDLSEPDALRQAPQGGVSQLKTVYFEYDSAELSPEAVRLLDQNAEFLRGNSELTIQIAGHTDERGTVEYNLNLGDRRAKAVKAYLMSRGIDGARLHTISYGEERPVETGSGDESLAKNRRAQFLVY